MALLSQHDITFGNLPYLATKIEANHRFGIDLELNLSKRNQTKIEPTDKIDKQTVIPESAFLKLLRTELKRPLNRF
jgi:hypothetical protein